MPIPKSLGGFGKKGDSNKWAWSTRLSEDCHQFLLDMKADYNLINNSETLRMAVFFMMKYFQKMMEKEGEKISRRTKAFLRNINAKRLREERQLILGEIHESLTLAEATDYAPLKAELLASAQELAEAYDMPWPPPALPLLARDSEAKYVLDRLLSTLREQQTNRASLRELARVCKFNSKDVKAILGRLEGEGYLTTHQEKRSGPETLWVQVPTYDNCVSTVEERA